MISRIKQIRTRWLPFALILAIGLTVISGCAETGTTPPPSGSELSGTIKINGSNTVTPLAAVWAEEFMKVHPKVNIAVSGPGSGAGIAALINGTTDICQTSREIKAKEIEQAKSHGVDPFEIPVALDALSVVVHPSNPVSELTFTQLSAIYTNRVSNWSEVGGSDAPIVVLARDTSSGTHVYFKENVVQMKGLPTEDKSLEYGTRVLLLPSTEEGVIEVAKNARAIFYPGLGYLSEAVKPLAVSRTADGPAVLPSVATALDGSYPIARPLLFYTDGEPVGVVKAFIDYALSAAGQEKVIELGYVPLE